ncbi:hypothetical protein DASC09_041530 [Saccharomycopsis crataegensis]|uniref:WW domain-containing protein n=1 Tax=Saccharomycopsis crataegensis TaxID=43959 RepID=A0AAV5QPN4_9ASCO|nr:hypothetical protein DASC09_041530 [Saccharomycopsis crataegensis]
MLPKFKVDLEGSDWSLVITSTGHRFYHNKVTNQSVWNYPNDDVGRLVHQLDRKEILVLIAKARGLKVFDKSQTGIQEKKKDVSKKEDAEQILAQKSEEVTNAHNENRDKVAATPQPAVNSEKEEKSETQKGIGLLSGYASSDDSDDSDDDSDDSDDDNEKSDDEAEPATIDLEAQDESSSEYETGSESESDSDVENGINLDELDDISDDEIEDDSKSLDPSKIQNFIELLQEFQLNPYNAWESESQKIFSDPRFLNIELDSQRKEIFNKWCTITLSATNNKAGITDTNTVVGNDEKTQESLDFLRSPEVSENSVVQYLDFLTRNFKANKLYIDFKRRHRSSPGFSDVSFTDKDRERLYVEFSTLKKKPVGERRKLVNNFLINSKILRVSINEISKDSGRMSKILQLFQEQVVGKLSKLTIDEARCALANVEKVLNVPESVRETTLYQALPTKERISTLYEVYSVLGNN